MSRASCPCTITRAEGRRTIIGAGDLRFPNGLANGVLLQFPRPRSRKFYGRRPLGVRQDRLAVVHRGTAQRIEPRPKLVFIDKDRGAEIFIRALGGQYETLDPGTPTGFNPLMLPDSGENREFLFQLFSFMLKPARVGEILTSSEEQVIRNAIKTVVSGPPRGGTWKPFRRCCATHSGRGGRSDVAP